jgi:DNA repair protein RadA/Sms
MSEVGASARARAVQAAPVRRAARPIAELDPDLAQARPTGVPELDRVLGGGLVPGSVVLLAGEPGVGKSTLLLDVAHRFAAHGQPALIVTGEESPAQVRLRAERIGALHPALYLAAENDLGALLTHVDEVSPGLLVVDSVQTVSTDTVDSATGGVPQIRAVAAALISVAKERGIATVIVGHVTKDGSIAGPRVLEHLVDVVLHFEGDQHSSLRLIRATKNRYGAADEIGCFEMREDGILGLTDPSGRFLSERASAVAGTCVTVCMEGKRPLITEIQALVARSANGGTPRRSVTDLDAGRVAMLLAILARHGGIGLGDFEVYAATVGGLRAAEPACDLAIALALASAARDLALPQTLCAIGEVSLSGDVRRVSGLDRRIAEAARLGFTLALVPGGQAGEPARSASVNGIDVIPVATLAEALGGIANLRARVGEARRPALHTVQGGRAGS